MGRDVLVNGSRGALDRADRRWRNRLLPVVVRVDPDVLAERRAARGREDAAAVRARLRRPQAPGEPAHPSRVVIANDGALADGARALARVIAAGGV